MILLFILSILLEVSISGRFKKHVENSAVPLFYTEPIYNISRWVKALNLQQCVFVEIGEKYCAIFVEVRPRKVKDIEEYYLGICDLETVYKWKLCPVALEKKRPKDCNFGKKDVEVTFVGTRVHRRLCDITGLSSYADHCQCKAVIGNQKLRTVTGFPTCFISNLPESICTPMNVCGTNKCLGITVLDQIYSVKCDETCKGHQPFCEEPEMESSLPLKVESYWSDWHKPDCKEPCPPSQFNVLEADCINSKTGKGSIDCLGPGTSCCPAEIEKCRCNVFMEDGVLKVIREFYLEIETEPKENDPQDEDLLKKIGQKKQKYVSNSATLFPRHRRNDYTSYHNMRFRKRNSRKPPITTYGHKVYLTKFVNPSGSRKVPSDHRNVFQDSIDIDYDFYRMKREEKEEEYSDDDDFDDEDEYEDTNAEDIAIEEEDIEDTTELTVTTTEQKEKEELNETGSSFEETGDVFEEYGTKVNESKKPKKFQKSSSKNFELKLHKMLLTSVFIGVLYF